MNSPSAVGLYPSTLGESNLSTGTKRFIIINVFSELVKSDFIIHTNKSLLYFSQDFGCPYVVFYFLGRMRSSLCSLIPQGIFCHTTKLKESSKFSTVSCCLKRVFLCFGVPNTSSFWSAPGILHSYKVYVYLTVISSEAALELKG